MPAPGKWLARTRAARSRPAPGPESSDPALPSRPLRRERDADIVAGYLQDAARYPGGRADEVCFPESEAEIASLLAEGRPLLVVGAQSSLTGGATPHGEIVVSTSAFNRMHCWTDRSVRCGAGVVLRDLETACAARDVYFAPVPTFDGATVGGVVSTDAAGAATFKHGTVRGWVEEISVVLACGEVLDVVRGDVVAHPDGWFEIERTSGARVRVPVPASAVPAVPKISAGYRGAAGMDLIDLFIGSEGTLGVVTEVRLRLAAPRPSWLTVLVAVADDREAVSLTRELRDEGLRTRAQQRERKDVATQGAGAHDDGGADVAAIEYMDARSLAILREDRVAERAGVTLPARARALLLVQVELPPACDAARAVDELAAYADASTRGPVASLCRILERRGQLEDAVPALPGQDDRRRALFALREAVPEGVNARIRDAALRSGEAISKSGGDVIVPFDRFEESLARYREILAATGLDAAIWGHISDGNVHPNLIAASAADMDRARAAQVAIGEVAIALGGSPLAEHGTGRNAGKKRLLEALHGKRGVESMRATKRALDPGWILAPGVLFDPE